jgi:hypothetical protein
MPTSFTKTASGGTDYGSPFVGPIDHTIGIPILVDDLTTAEVDANGVLKPGVPVKRNGGLVNGAGQVVFGCIAEATKVAASNSATDLAAVTTDPEVAVVLIGCLNRDIVEDILGRALSADEVSALAAAGSLIKLLD